VNIHITFFFSSRRRHTRSYGDWSSDVCSSDLGRRAVEPDAFDLAEPLERVGGELVLMLLDRLESDLRDVVDRGAETDRLGDRLQIGRASCRERMERMESESLMRLTSCLMKLQI